MLDTGVDATHPDLAGKIADSKSFVPDEAVDDRPRPRHPRRLHHRRLRSGLRRHAQGRRAPGAQLVIGKVLSDGGSGPDSGVIEGMEWAAASGAKVVSMSLGDGPTDGTDPLSQSVNT